MPCLLNCNHLQYMHIFLEEWINNCLHILNATGNKAMITITRVFYYYFLMHHG